MHFVVPPSGVNEQFMVRLMLWQVDLQGIYITYGYIWLDINTQIVLFIYFTGCWTYQMRSSKHHTKLASSVTYRRLLSDRSRIMSAQIMPGVEGRRVETADTRQIHAVRSNGLEHSQCVCVCDQCTALANSNIMTSQGYLRNHRQELTVAAATTSKRNAADVQNCSTECKRIRLVKCSR